MRKDRKESEPDIDLEEIGKKLDNFYENTKDKKDEEEKKETENCVKHMKQELKVKLDRKISRMEILGGYRKEHEFLSQQIDERMHQIWTLGALFVPVSFLIFAQAVAYGDRIEFFGSLLVALASLICYFLWFEIYMRARRFNKLSYPRIHVLELVLDVGNPEEPYFHGHMHLGYIREKYDIKTKPEKLFKLAKWMLVALWALHLSIMWMPGLLTYLANLPKP